MSAPLKLTAFAVALAVVFGAAVLAGGAVDPGQGGEPGAAEAAGGHGGAEEKVAHPVRGVTVAEQGMRLVLDTPELRRGRTQAVRFRIAAEPGGETVRDFDVEHTKRLHLIVARRDLTGFQHLHPVQAADGSWSAPLLLDEPGSYRLFADFSRDGEPVTLATDLRVDGAADLRALPAPAAAATSDSGYDVRLDAGHARPGEEASLRFAIARAGRAVETEPYLGAGGHLVALREGDLAFLHVHPTGHGGSAAFAATFPTAGRYRLFLQFKHAGRVHTAAFTQEVS